MSGSERDYSGCERLFGDTPSVAVRAFSTNRKHEPRDLDRCLGEDEVISPSESHRVYVLMSCILESCCEVCGIPSVYVALAPNLQTERAILRLSRRVHVILFYVHINTVRV